MKKRYIALFSIMTALISTTAVIFTNKTTTQVKAEEIQEFTNTLNDETYFYVQNTNQYNTITDYSDDLFDIIVQTKYQYDYEYTEFYKLDYYIIQPKHTNPRTYIDKLQSINVRTYDFTLIVSPNLEIEYKNNNNTYKFYTNSLTETQKNNIYVYGEDPIFNYESFCVFEESRYIDPEEAKTRNFIQNIDLNNFNYTTSEIQGWYNLLRNQDYQFQGGINQDLPQYETRESIRFMTLNYWNEGYYYGDYIDTLQYDYEVIPKTAEIINVRNVGTPYEIELSSDEEFVITTTIKYYTTHDSTPITPTTEVIDIGGLMLTILGMPFQFISQAFDLTIFPNTPYEINFANLFKGLIAFLTIIFIIKVFTSGFSVMSNYTDSANKRIDKADKKFEKRSREKESKKE